MTKNLFAKIASAVAIVASLVIPMTALAGYEPANRTMRVYSGPQTPAFTYPVFNSWLNTPYGDERAFYDASTTGADGSYKDVTNIKPGDTVTLRMYVHNGASPELNDNGTGIAKNARVQVYLPAAASKDQWSYGYIIADNTNPGWVSDTAEFKSDTPVTLDYVPGTAKLTNQHATFALSDSIINKDTNFNAASANAAKIGDASANGDFKACFEFASIITLQVKVKGGETPKASLSVSKANKVAGSTTDYATTSNAKIGDTINWTIQAKNTSAADATNTVVRDTMAAHSQIVTGSVKVVNANGSIAKTFTAAEETAFFGTTGVNLGTVKAGESLMIQYKTTIKDDLTAAECNPTVVNKAFVHADSIAEQSATSNVVIAHPCTTPTTPLPETGAEGLAGVLGTGVIGASVVAYRRSKQQLVDALKR